MTAMYTITISGPGADAETSLVPDLESALEFVEKSLSDRVRPGRRVRWEVRCPSGRTAMGSLTVNRIDESSPVETAEHMELVRDVLVEEARGEPARA